MTASPGDEIENDEHGLLKRALNGDAEAFGDLYLRYLDPIYRYIYFRVGSQEEAEDLTEEVFARAWEALSTFTLRGQPFTSWLYRIAHNLVVDYRRRQRPLPMPEEGLRTIAAQTLSPEEALAQSQEVAVLIAALRELDDEEQQVILLRFVQDLSHSEVAAIIGKSEGASRVIQHRALTKLQRALNSRKMSHE